MRQLIHFLLSCPSSFCGRADDSYPRWRWHGSGPALVSTPALRWDLLDHMGWATIQRSIRDAPIYAIDANSLSFTFRVGLDVFWELCMAFLLFVSQSLHQCFRLPYEKVQFPFSFHILSIMDACM